MTRVRHQDEHRALQQAKRVPWRTLAAAAEEYTDWEVFTLWVRAVVDAARRIPADVAREMVSRASLALERLDAEATVNETNHLGRKIWHAVRVWAEMNVFVEPKRAGWLDAVRYFSSLSLRSIKAWAYWESVDKQWRAAPPDQFPTYPQWQCEVAAVNRLSDGNGLAQQIMETVESQPEWSKHLRGFSDLLAFSLWMELVLDVERSTSGLVARELAQRYSGFRVSRSAESKKAVRALHEWAVQRDLIGSNQRELLAALSFHVMRHPSYHAMRSYARRCHDLWRDEYPEHLPSFKEWREAADGYFER